MLWGFEVVVYIISIIDYFVYMIYTQGVHIWQEHYLARFNYIYIESERETALHTIDISRCGCLCVSYTYTCTFAYVSLAS